MIFYLGLSLLLLAAALCLALSRLVPTRWLGALAALVSLAASLVFLFPDPGAAPDLVWLTLVDLTLRISGDTAAAAWPGLALTGAATVLLAALAAAIAPSVRGFGSLFAWVLLALAAGWLGLGTPTSFAPLAWALVALCAYAAARASGALQQSEQVPRGPVVGLAAALLLMLGLLAVQPALEQGVPPSGAVLAAVLLATLMYSGTAPFQGVFSESSQSPAALGALFYGVLFPLLALSTLNGFLAELPLIPPFWRPILLGVGAAGALASAAAALGIQPLRQRLSRLLGFQSGLALATLGLPGPEGQLAFQAALSNLALSSSLAALAVAVLERSSGSDDLAGGRPGSAQLAGLAWLVAGLAALGLPPFWGFWSRIWLLAALDPGQGWVAALLLAATLAAALAYLTPVARFWGRAGHQGDAAALAATGFERLLILLPMLVLLLSGVWPQLAPGFGLLAGQPALVPIDAATQFVSIACAAGGLLLTGLLANRSWATALPQDPDLGAAVLDADALAASLSGLAALSWPEALIERTGDGLLRLSSWAQALLGLFEGRYYLAGVLLGLICLLVLMAQ